MQICWKKYLLFKFFFLCFLIGNSQGVDKEEFLYSISNDTSCYCLGSISNAYPSNKFHNYFIPYRYSPPEKVFNITGETGYDYLYRSLLDTPYYQRDFQEHIVFANLNVQYKNQFPFQIVLRKKFNNSPVFRDVFDFSGLYNDRMMLSSIKKLLIEKSVNFINDELYELTEKEKGITDSLNKEIEILKSLENNFHPKLQFQKLVAVKEYFIENKVIAIRDSLNFLDKDVDNESLRLEVIKKYDSVLSLGWDDWINTETELAPVKQIISDKEKYETQVKNVNKIKKQADSLAYLIKSKTAVITNAINKIKNKKELDFFLNSNPDFKSVLPEKYQSFLAVKKAGIGRTWLNYSELTIKNLPVTGAHIEINSNNVYFAAGGGKINYLFRDFIHNKYNQNSTGQYLWFVRAGIGNIERNNIIFSFYNGKKSYLNFRNDSIPTGSFPGNNLTSVNGFAIEANLHILPYSKLSIEVARSDYAPYLPEDKEQGLQQIINLKTRENEAFSIKLESLHPQTNSVFSGFYRKSGSRFQSFNLNVNNSAQDAFSIKFKQPLFENKLIIEAGIKKNDYSNPLLNPGYTNNVLLKTFTGSLRLPKLPSLTIGYYPGTQLSLIDKEILVENHYNTLTGVLSYNYKMGTFYMNSTASFVKFYNNQQDSGFIYFNASNWLVSQFVFINNFNSETGFSISVPENMKVTNFYQNFSFVINKIFNLGTGLKLNSIKDGASYIGSMVNLGISGLKKQTLMINGEKSFLPGPEKNLLPLYSGRITYIKRF